MKWGATAASRGSSATRRTRGRMLGRSIVVVGFAAMSWSALSGVAHAFDGTAPTVPVTKAGSTQVTPAPTSSAETAPPSTTGDSAAVPQLTHPLAGATHLLDALPISVPGTSTAVRPTQPDSLAAPAAINSHAQSTGEDGPTAAPTPHRLPDVVNDLVTGAHTATGTGSSPRTPNLLAAVHDTVRDTVRTTVDQVATTAGTTARTTAAAVDATVATVGSTLTATPDRPANSVLTGVLDSLGVDEVLPTDSLGALPLPTLPLVNEPVGVVPSLLPGPSGQTGNTPGAGDESGTGEQPGGRGQLDASAPTVPVAPPAAPILLPDAAAQSTAQASASAIDALSLLLPEPRAGGTLLPTLPDGANASTATGISAHAGRVRDPLLASLLSLPHGGQSDDSALPIPTGPSAPGGQGGGSTDGGQAGNGPTETFRLPDIRPSGLAQAESWGLSAAPAFDPGFSPD